MPALRLAHDLPRLKDPFRDAHASRGLSSSQPAARTLEVVAAPADLTREELHPEIAGARRLQERAELLLGVLHFTSQRLRLVALPSAHLPLTERLERDPLNVLIEQPRGDHRGRRASALGVPDGADVRRGPAPFSAPGPGHHVPAARATGQPGEQRGLLEASGGPRPRHLRSVESLHVDDRWVRGRIHVHADAELAEVDAVLQQVPRPSRRHLQDVSDLHEGRSGSAPRERLLHALSLLLDDDQAARVRVAGVPEWRLAALPDPRGSRALPQKLELLGVTLAFGDVDGLLHVPHHPTRHGARVELLPDADHAPTCGLHALPQFITAPARQPREIRADDSGVDAGLDALDRGAQARPVVDGSAAAHVELDGQHDDRHPEALGLTSADAFLLPCGVEAVGVLVAAREAAHPDHGSKRKAYMVHDSHSASATLNPVLSPGARSRCVRETRSVLAAWHSRARARREMGYSVACVRRGGWLARAAWDLGAPYGLVARIAGWTS